MVAFKKIQACVDFDIVYDVDTKVLYTVSNGMHNRGCFTLLVNADGTPRLYEDQNVQSEEYKMPSSEEMEDLFQRMKKCDKRLTTKDAGWTVYPMRPTVMNIGYFQTNKTIVPLWSFDFSKCKLDDVINYVEKYCKEHKNQIAGEYTYRMICETAEDPDCLT